MGKKKKKFKKIESEEKNTETTEASEPEGQKTVSEMTEEKVSKPFIAPDENGDDSGKEEKEEEEKKPKDLEEELLRQKDKYIRLMAEFDNYKRRTGNEYGRLVELANERLMLDIIEVRESFQRALDMSDKKHDYSSLLEGMNLVFNKLEDNLKKNGLSIFAEDGEEFDPEIHDAMMKRPDEKIPEDCIADIYERGYKLKNHVIKHAKVIVSSGPQAESKEKCDIDEKEDDE